MFSKVTFVEEFQLLAVQNVHIKKYVEKGYVILLRWENDESIKLWHFLLDLVCAIRIQGFQITYSYFELVKWYIVKNIEMYLQIR